MNAIAAAGFAQDRNGLGPEGAAERPAKTGIAQIHEQKQHHPTCSDCGKGLSRETKGVKCRGCLYPPPQPRYCSCCETPISARQNKSGLCRRCQLAAMQADPTATERRLSALRDVMKSPKIREKIKRNVLASRSKPGVRERYREIAKATYPLTLGSPQARAAAMAPETIAKRARTHSLNDMAWCPPEYLAEYRKLIGRKVLAADARKIILAKLTPFERQMHALRNGARLIEKPILRKSAPDYTLGGVTDWAA